MLRYLLGLIVGTLAGLVLARLQPLRAPAVRVRGVRPLPSATIYDRLRRPTRN